MDKSSEIKVIDGAIEKIKVAIEMVLETDVGNMNDLCYADDLWADGINHYLAPKPPFKGSFTEVIVAEMNDKDFNKLQAKMIVWLGKCLALSFKALNKRLKFEADTKDNIVHTNLNMSFLKDELETASKVSEYLTINQVYFTTESSDEFYLILAGVTVEAKEDLRFIDKIEKHLSTLADVGREDFKKEDM